MKVIKNLFFILIFSLLTFSAFLQQVQGAAEQKLPNPLGASTDSVQKVAGGVINSILGIIGSIALIMFIYGGFTWLTSGGSAENVKRGREIIVWAAIGLIVIFLSYGLVKFLILNIK
jgi:hypothetical protein